MLLSDKNLVRLVKKDISSELLSITLSQPETKPQSSLKKFDDEQQVVFGEVYVPDFPDSQGDYMTATTIREMAYGFMKKNALHKIDVQHTQEESGSYIVESFIAREDDPIFISGSWVVGVKIPDNQIWKSVKDGTLNGFSLDGFGVRQDNTLEMNIPSLLKGETDTTQDHSHGFLVKFSDNGEFLGGETTPAKDGHVHKITSGTITDVVNGHSHRFSFVEGVLDAN